MPRFRFQWSNIGSDLIQALIDTLKLTGTQDPAELLRKKYGAKPGDDFIKDAWAILLDNWLAKDSQFASAVANGARTNELGNTSLNDDLDYLRSCRNTIGLRREALKVFLAYGEQSKTDLELNKLLPSNTGNNASEDAAQENEQGASPSDQENSSLVDLVKDAISILYSVDVEKILVDDDGDIGVPSGSALVFARFPTSVNAIRLFSILLRNIPEGTDVYDTLNDINANINAGFLYFSNNMIFLEHTILADGGLSLLNVIKNIDYFTDTADFFDDKLQERFGGDLFRVSPAADEIEA
jgi:hypothetical protein